MMEARMGKGYDHGKGQRDHNAGRYKPPHSLLQEVLSGPKANRDGHKRNAQYRSGWKNACDTAKRGR